MANFEAKVRLDYLDVDGLVLDLRSQDLTSDEGTHDGADNAAVLSDSTASWGIDALVGKVVQNVTDGSYAVITANTATTVTGTLVGGTDGDWDDGDAYSIQGSTAGRLEWPNNAPAARYPKAEYDGAHDGGNNSATLVDSTAPWVADALVGMVAFNVTDNSWGLITANTTTVVTATLASGADNDWDTGDVYEIRDPRFGVPYQDTAADQPVVRTVSGRRLMEFTRSRGHELLVPLVGSRFPATWWTQAVEFAKGADSANSQVIFILGSATSLVRRDGSGDFGFSHGAAPVAGSGDHDDGVWVLESRPGTNDADYLKEGVSQLTGAAAAAAVQAGDPIGYIGSANGSSFLDGQISSLRVWDRALSPLEVDFAFQSLAADATDHSAQDRATMELREWTDETGDHPRINPQAASPHRFIVAKFPGLPRRVQVAASVDGKVRPDSELGGKLFDISVVEVPGAVPLVSQDSGWSAVFDLTIQDEGHHAFLVSREDGGGVIVHLVAEDTT